MQYLAHGRASSRGAEIVCFPEAWLPGLRGQDFVVPPFDRAEQARVLETVARQAREQSVAVILGMERIVAQGRQMLDWHARHRYCAVCGHATSVKEAGYLRECDECDAQHFPRTDPVVIMLALNGDKCLLGRQAQWPQGFYSALAGFVEPGETIEEAVARELHEEAGIKTGEVFFHSTQPWPYPSSLMIGCYATAATTEITVDVARTAMMAATVTRSRLRCRRKARSLSAMNARSPASAWIAFTSSKIRWRSCRVSRRTRP